MTDLRRAVRSQLTAMLTSPALRSPHAALLVDRTTLRVLSHGVRMSELLDEAPSVTLVELVHSPREARAPPGLAPSMDAIYFLEPTVHSLEGALADYAPASPAAYGGSVHFIFSRRLPDALLALIRNSPVLGRIATLRGPLLTCAVIFSDALSVCVYVAAFATKTTHRMSGNHLYDFFMGASLNPRIGSLDIKMWAEVRVSWITLFLLTLSEAAKQVEVKGSLSWPLAFMVLAHWLYANACCKGEELIVPTWDIFYEKYGWMLCYWNLCGVPFMYSFNSAFLNQHAGPVDTPIMLVVALFTALLCAYYVFDTANAQKNIYRQQLRGAYKKRPWYIFPQFSYMSCGPTPKHIKTKAGSPLLVDGWYKYARKVHYTADASMAMMWGLSCGVSHFLPYFYFVFFSSMITHRALRDNEKCARKYGDDWVEYCRQVPYVLIPGVW